MVYQMLVCVCVWGRRRRQCDQIRDDYSQRLISNDASVIKYCNCAYTWALCDWRGSGHVCACAGMSKRKKLTETMKWFFFVSQTFVSSFALMPTQNNNNPSDNKLRVVHRTYFTCTNSKFTHYIPEQSTHIYLRRIVQPHENRKKNERTNAKDKKRHIWFIAVFIIFPWQI